MAKKRIRKLMAGLLAMVLTVQSVGTLVPMETKAAETDIVFHDFEGENSLTTNGSGSLTTEEKYSGEQSMKYSKEGSYAGWNVEVEGKNGTVDVSDMEYITFWLKESGTNNLAVKLIDASGSNAEVWTSMNAVAGEWTLFSVPLADYSGIDMTAIKTVALYEWNDGIFYIDDITFTKALPGEEGDGTGDGENDDKTDEEATPVIYEAEDGTVCDSSTARKIHTGTSNASGGKSATLYSEEYITYTVSVNSAGTYDITMRYAGNSTGSAKPETVPLEITVNEEAEVYDVSWPADYNTFRDQKITAELVEGENTIVITNKSTDATIFANIDYISVVEHSEESGDNTGDTPVNPPVEEPVEPGEEVSTTYEAEDGSVSVLTKVNEAKTGRIRTDLSNASGGGAAVLYPTDYVTYTVSVNSAGTCDLVVRNATGVSPTGATPASAPLEVKVNDAEAVAHDIGYHGNAYNTFYTYKCSVDLVQGENTIVFTNASEEASLFINIDNITIVENPAPAVAAPAVGTVEAESVETYGGILGGSIGTNASFSGGQYVEAMNQNVGTDMSKAKFLTYQVNAEEAGYYKVKASYATSSEMTKFAVKVNDGDWAYRYVESTGAWNTVGVEEYVIELAEGINTITVTGSLDSGWIILDKFEMEKTDETPTVDPLAPIEGHEPEEGEVKKTARELQEEELVSFRGRNMNIEDSVSFDYSASGFEFNFEGEGDIRANLTMTASEKFAVVVDGVVTYISVTAGDASIYLAEDLEQGAHTIKVYKTQEAMTGLAQLNYMTYDADAVLTPVETDYNFLIIGASSTCGNQIDPDTGAEDGYLSFSSLVSRAYNATWQQVSCSGRGVVQGTRGEAGWAASTEGMLAEMYRTQSWFRDKETAYDPASYTPDVIITNFNNDFSGGTRAQFYDMDTVYEMMMDFVAELRATYPNAYIALTYGNYPTFESDGTYNSPTVIQGYYDAVEAYREETGDNMVEYIELPCLAGGASNHSNYEEHEYIAELLSAKISTALNIENPLPLSHFEIESGELVNPGTDGKVTRITTWASSVSKHSNNTYVEGMNVDLAGASIAANGSNVRYVSVPVTVPQTGYYKIEVNYGTDKAPVIYVRADEDNWKELMLTSTGDWNKIGQNAEYTVFLTEGEHIVDVTGATNSGAYVNLDRIDTIFVRAESQEEITNRENRTEIQAIIDEVESLDSSEYTADSWRDLVTAVQMAALVLENPSASAESVSSALANLQAAKAALVRADGGNNNQGGDNQGGNTPGGSDQGGNTPGGNDQGGTTGGSTTDDNKKPHVHTWSEVKVITDATTTTTGVKGQVCTGCNEINPDTKVVMPKYTVTLNAKSAPLQVKKSTKAIKATVVEGDKIVKWESSNKKIATVNNKGVIKAKNKTGKVKITAISEKGAKATVTIKVQKKKVKTTKVAVTNVSKKGLTLNKKEKFTLETKLTPVTSPEAVKYSTSKKKVATVSKKGVITAKKKGTAYITVKSGSKKVKIKVTVK